MKRNEPRTVWSTLRLSPAELRKIRFLAERAGLRPSSYIRAAALDEQPEPPRAPRTGRTRFSEPRTRRCEVRFHPSEWERVERLAATVSLPPGRYVREAAVGYQLASRVNANAIAQLARVGGNLNQITRLAHTTGRIDDARLRRALAELDDVLGRLL